MIYSNNRAIVPEMNSDSNLTVRTDTGGDPDLIGVALALLREAGLAEVTQRALAARAGVPAATLQHRFGSKEEMLRRLFLRLFQAEEQALAALAEGAARPPLSPVALCGLLTSLVVAPGAGTPAVLEALVQALRSPLGRPAAQSWLAALHALWRRLLADHGGDIDGAAWFLAELQIGILLLSLGSGRPQETALVNAEVARFACFGREDGTGDWFGRLIRAAADSGLLSEIPEAGAEQGPMLQRLLDAGVEIIASAGPDELSFRTLAARAGTSLSAVTHHFPKRERLLSSVFQYLHDRLTQSEAATVAQNVDAADQFVASTTGAGFAGAPLFLIFTELSLAAARMPGFADMAWRFRLTRGRDFARRADPSFDPSGRRAFTLHARSLWQSGCALVQATRAEPDELPALLRRRYSTAERVFQNGLFAALR